jgi:N-acyl-D-amino-acid deacylase
MSDEHDILIRNAFIVDGTGAPGYRGSVAVKGERIAAVGDVRGGAETVIDAKGMAVTPGFIDVHNHGDMTIMYYPRADGFVRQGITTFVGGNCGSSPGPFGDLVSVGLMTGEIIQDLSPDMYYPSGLFRREEVNPMHRELFGWEIDWHTLGEFFRKLEAKGISPNYAPLLGHHPIRIMAMGTDNKRKATPAEVEEMKKHVEQAMKDGCVGFSAGRDYEPSIYADLDELVALAKVAAEYGGVYACHSLRTGLRKTRRPGEPPPIKINGLLETIEVGRKAKIPVEVSHLGALYDVVPTIDGELNEAAAKATLKIVDDARKEGIDVTFDVIPGIRAFGTSSNIWLAGTLLPWLRVAGSREQLAKALRMREFRGEIKDRIWEGK